VPPVIATLVTLSADPSPSASMSVMVLAEPEEVMLMVTDQRTVLLKLQ